MQQSCLMAVDQQTKWGLARRLQRLHQSRPGFSSQARQTKVIKKWYRNCIGQYLWSSILYRLKTK